MRYACFFGLALIGVLLPCRTSAAVYRVKADAAGTPHDGSSWSQAFTTVQAGINAASSGDEVWAAQGTYTGTITTKDGVALRGGYAGTGASPDDRNWSTYVSVLDGNHAGSVVTVPANAGSGTIVEGFTITNGAGTAPQGYSVFGGGIYCLAASSPGVFHCTFTNNQASPANSPPGRGGAIYCAPDGHPDIENNTFTGNSALYGGAIYASAGRMTVQNNVFDSNTAVGVGGALSIPTDCSATVVGNTFRNCSAPSGGGAVFCDTVSNPTFRMNVFQGNSTPGPGGAIYADQAGTASYPCWIMSNVFVENSAGQGDAIYSQGTVRIINNTFARNKAYSTGSDAGALFFYNVSVVYNNILLNNETAIGFYATSSGTAAGFHNNCFYGNSLDHDAKSPDVIGVNGNFSADPKLVDPANNDFHETAVSPCVDTGDPKYDTTSDPDIDGQTRIYGPGVDIGADEFQPVMVFTTEPGNGPKGGQLAPQPVVKQQDAQGNTYATGSGSVSVSLTPGSGTTGAALTGTTVASFVNGIATYTNLGVDMGGTGYRLTATASGLSSIESTSFNVTVPRVYVTATGNDSNEGITWATALASIHAALAEVDSPGEVWVKAGTYSANVTLPSGVSLLGGFRGRETSSGSRHPFDVVSTLEGAGSGPVVTVAAGAGSTTVLDGFTITGGVGKLIGLLANSYRAGGGIYIKGASPTITRNTIIRNTAVIGGGVYIEAGSPLIQYNVIQSNTVSCTARITAGGAGISAVSGSAASILDNLITNNAGTGTNPLLGMGALGGGVGCASAGPTLRNNTIAENTASGSGGGIYLNGSSPILISNIVAKNGTGLYAENGSHPSFRYNDFYGNGGYNASGVTYPAGTNGNISADPLFVAVASRDYHVASWSPCVNAGDTTAVLEAEKDLDGNFRVAGSNVDIGAYETTLYGVSDAGTALRIAGGLSTASASNMARLDAEPAGGNGAITLADALRIARKAAGLDANP